MSEPVSAPSPVDGPYRGFDRASFEHLVAVAEATVGELRQQVDDGRKRLESARASHRSRQLEAQSGTLVLAAQEAIEEDARRHQRVVAALASTAEWQSEAILLAACRKVEALADVVGRRVTDAAPASSSELVIDLTDSVPAADAVAL